MWMKRWEKYFDFVSEELWFFYLFYFTPGKVSTSYSFRTATRIMFSKGMVSKSKYWISEKNKGDEYSKTPKKPLCSSTGFVSGTHRNHNACSFK